MRGIFNPPICYIYGLSPLTAYQQTPLVAGCLLQEPHSSLDTAL